MSASKTMRAARHSPAAPSSGDDYKGDTEQEDDAMSIGASADEAHDEEEDST